jgi:hypothetical protein
LSGSSNSNPAAPFFKTFYNTIPGNAPFDVPEAQLRAAMYVPPGFTWAQSTLQNPGPGSFSRVSGQCGAIVAPGVSLSDVIETEALIPAAVLNIFAYLPKSLSEPAIKAYATY